MSNGREKRPLFTASNRRPLPIMDSPPAPEPRPLALASEISQQIARRCAGNLFFDQKENLDNSALDAGDSGSRRVFEVQRRFRMDQRVSRARGDGGLGKSRQDQFQFSRIRD